MKKRLLIANRGEIAIRIIRSAHKLGITSVVLQSDKEPDALYLKYANEIIQAKDANDEKPIFLNATKIVVFALAHQIDLVHPGYGFLSENPDFAALCEENGINFIGPSPELIRNMGIKTIAKKMAIETGLPLVPGSEGAVVDAQVAKAFADKIGYPVILKASAGGGGRGMRIVWNDEEVEPAWHSAKQEAGAAFGNDGLYMEKYIEDPRHIEIQIAGDQYGKVCHLSERDCSIQRRHQKLLEETPSPFMTPELREKMGEAAKAAAQIINYEGVGTVEFLVDKHRNFYFMEMNTRIQVEHPVTKEVINYDLVKEQILIAAGVPISGKDHYPTKHAIECRINAEDIHNNFRPCPGKITQLNRPGGHGVRVDTHIYAGYTIPPYYDSMVAKLIVSAQTRDEAIVKMERALGEFIIEGVKTTVPLHLQLMRDPDFRAGNFTTAFMNTFEIK